MDGIAKFEVSRVGTPSSPVATRLLRALDGAYVTKVLREQIEAQGWNRTAPESMSLRRLHDRGRHGFVIEYNATLKDDAGTRSEILFGELPHTQPAATMARALRRISKNFCTESCCADVTSNFILLDRLGLIIRPRGFDERIDGLRLLWQDEARRDTGVLGGLRPRLLTHRLGKRAGLYPGWEDGVRRQVLHAYGALNRATISG